MDERTDIGVDAMKEMSDTNADAADAMDDRITDALIELWFSCGNDQLPNLSKHKINCA